jgi:DNA-binding PadR family transcriptional regulator
MKQKRAEDIAIGLTESQWDVLDRTARPWDDGFWKGQVAPNLRRKGLLKVVRHGTWRGHYYEVTPLGHEVLALFPEVAK